MVQRAHLHPTPRAHPPHHLPHHTCQRLAILPAPFFNLSLFKFSSFVLSIVVFALNYFDYSHFCFKSKNIPTGNTLDVPVFSSIVSLNRIRIVLAKRAPYAEKHNHQTLFCQLFSRQTTLQKRQCAFLSLHRCRI